MSFRKSVLFFMWGIFLFQLGFASEIDQFVSILREKGVFTDEEVKKISLQSDKDSNSKIASWVQNLTLKGDLRLRHQTDWNDAEGTRN